MVTLVKNDAHPFMKGNGCSTRIWFDLYAETFSQAVCGLELNKNEYLSAIRESVSDSTHIKALIQHALTTKFDDQERFMPCYYE